MCSDMWKPYLKVKKVREEAGACGHRTVLDQFHVMQQFGKAMDEIRAEEAKKLVKQTATSRLAEEVAGGVYLEANRRT